MTIGAGWMDEIGYKSEEMRVDEAREQMRATGEDVRRDLRKRGAEELGGDERGETNVRK